MNINKVSCYNKFKSGHAATRTQEHWLNDFPQNYAVSLNRDYKNMKTYSYNQNL